MLQPVTDVVRNFNSQCLKLAEYLRESETGSSTPEKQEKISNAVHTFFDILQQLPNQIAPLDTRETILFEIDRTLLGTYGARVFTAAESTNSTKKLLRDLAALWQRYYLIAGLARTEQSDGYTAGTMSFYEDWIKTENVGIEESEYDRILANVSILLQSSENLNVPTKIQLFSLMGKILMTLGVAEDFAQTRLHNHLDEIKQRGSDLSGVSFSEILLCLQVLWVRGKGVDALGANSVEIQKAIRYWSSRDDFLNNLFQSWGWHWENDYSSPLPMGDQIYLKERSPLFLSWSNNTMKLGIGHSFLELSVHKQKNPMLTSLFQPLPIFMFGHSGVGKSSYISAFCYEAQMRAGRPVTLGRELQVYYESISESWRSGVTPPTSGCTNYNFWEDLNLTSYSTFDYGGKDSQPDQWEHQLQEIFRNAKGLLFFIDEQDYLEPVKLRKKANWFDAILQYWVQSNPNIRHVPIGLVLTKCDRVFGDSLSQLKRNSLIPSSFQAGLVESLLPHRFPKMNEELKSPFGRLRDCLLRDRANNIHPVLQDVLQTLLDNFAQFFNRMIDLTYNYQIFVTSALPPRDINDPVFPWGVKDSMMWMLNILEKFHLRESLVKFKSEESQIESEIKILREDMAQMQRYREEISFANAEITRLRSKTTIFQVTMKDRIKYHEENKQRAEQDFMTILNRYIKIYQEMYRNV
ncbi:MAG: GTPase domain-containing protein [Bacteroidota bacterium]|nr:GTPase domain-containing protein [Bacteroidota bacterium]